MTDERVSRPGGPCARRSRRAARRSPTVCGTKPEPQALAGKILGLLFFNPSVCARSASLQAAMAKLGGILFVIAAGQGTWQLETRRGAVMNGARRSTSAKASGTGPLL
jgi:ornithine carbamoyltransferase